MRHLLFKREYQHLQVLFLPERNKTIDGELDVNLFFFCFDPLTLPRRCVCTLVCHAVPPSRLNIRGTQSFESRHGWWE